MKDSEALAQAFGLYTSMPFRGSWAAIKGPDGELRDFRDAFGTRVTPTDPDVCAVCSLGALYRVLGSSTTHYSSNDPSPRRFLEEAAREISQEKNLGHLYAARINDHHPELVEEMFTRAIAKAKAEEASCAT